MSWSLAYGTTRSRHIWYQPLLAVPDATSDHPSGLVLHWARWARQPPVQPLGLQWYLINRSWCPHQLRRCSDIEKMSKYGPLVVWEVRSVCESHKIISSRVCRRCRLTSRHGVERSHDGTERMKTMIAQVRIRIILNQHKRLRINHHTNLHCRIVPVHIVRVEDILSLHLECQLYWKFERRHS